MTSEFDLNDHLSDLVGRYEQDSPAGTWYSLVQNEHIDHPLDLDFLENYCPFCFEGNNRRKVADPDNVRGRRVNVASFGNFLLADPTKILLKECEERSTLECIENKTKLSPLFCDAPSCIIRLYKSWKHQGLKIFDVRDRGGKPSIAMSRLAASTSRISLRKNRSSMRRSVSRTFKRKMNMIDDLHSALFHDDEGSEERDAHVFRLKQHDKSRRYVHGTMMSRWLSQVQKQIITNQPINDSFCPFCFTTDGSGRVALSDQRKALSTFHFAQFLKDDRTGILLNECRRRGTIVAFRSLGVNRSYLDFCNQRLCFVRIRRSYHKKKIAEPDIDLFKAYKFNERPYGQYDVMTLLNGTTITSDRDLAKVRLPIQKDKVDIG